MENFERSGRSPFGLEGGTRERNIHFSNGSHLYIYAGGDYNSFRLRFGRDSCEGWSVNPNSLDQLIAELLYIRKDIKVFQTRDVVREDVWEGGGILADLERPFIPAARLHSDDEVDEEDEDGTF